MSQRANELNICAQRLHNYSWIARPVQLHKKLICQKLEVDTKNPRPPLESSREGASKWGGTHFVKLFFGDLFFLTPQKTTFQKGPTPILMRLSVAILAAVSDLLYLPPIVGRLILYKSPAVACETRKMSVFDLQEALSYREQYSKTSLKPMFDRLSKEFRKYIGTN